jgi:hypothetical protein
MGSLYFQEKIGLSVEASTKHYDLNRKNQTKPLSK